MMTILLVLLIVATLELSFEIWRLRRGNRKHNEVTREQIAAQLRDLEWTDFGGGDLRAQTGLSLDVCIDEYGGKYIAASSRARLDGGNIERIVPTIDEAKKEARAWQVEQVYRLFKHD